MSKDLISLVEKIEASELASKINDANLTAADMLINADPVWVDILPAGEIVEGLGDYTVTHSGPPIDYENMTALHKRGMISACLFEGWAKTEEEAERLMLEVHNNGSAIVGRYTWDIACTKQQRVQTLAAQEEFPLRVTIEQE